MSADTTVVIAAHRHTPDGELAYTAAVVQAVENLTTPTRQDWAMESARAYFLDRHRVWFTGEGGLSRAKQFANLLAAEQRETSILEFEDRPIIEIGTDRVYLLSRKGKRKPEECESVVPKDHGPFQWRGEVPQLAVPDRTKG